MEIFHVDRLKLIDIQLNDLRTSVKLYEKLIGFDRIPMKFSGTRDGNINPLQSWLKRVYLVVFHTIYFHSAFGHKKFVISLLKFHTG